MPIFGPKDLRSQEFNPHPGNCAGTLSGLAVSCSYICSRTTQGAHTGRYLDASRQLPRIGAIAPVRESMSSADLCRHQLMGE